MDDYYVSCLPQANGDYEVHKGYCIYLPAERNRHALGRHKTCDTAIKEAKEKFDQVNGCFYCSKTCHTE